jgi:toxin ParE1/3/4
MKVRFSDDANADLENIQAYIGRDNTGRALTFVRELALAAIAVGDAPEGYPELTVVRGRGLRRKVYGSYLIIYRTRSDQVEIVRILHGARDLMRILGESRR